MKYIYTLLLIVTLLLALAHFASAYKTVRFVSEFGGKGEALGKFSDKTRFAFDRDNNVYVLDIDNFRVQKLDPDGKPVMEITPGTDFSFSRPMDIAVDENRNIYVADWKSVHIQGTATAPTPKVFNYGPCVHKFSNDGKFIATFTLEDLSQKSMSKHERPVIEKAIPAVDTDGNFALMIVQGKTDRQIYVSADAEGNIYILDQDTIYKLSPSGEILPRFGERGSGPGQLDKSTGIAVDGKGNVYVADTGNHRVSKFSPDGRFLLSFGKEGDNDRRFTDELYITAASDGTVLVSDSARYEKVLRTSLKHRKLINSNDGSLVSILVTGQDDPLIPRRREFKTIIRRLQRFDENGKFQEKILYRIDKSDPELRDLEFKDVDKSGNLYLIDKDRLVIRKYAVQSPLQWSAVEKTFTYRFQYSGDRTQIDNFYDLDPYFDFDEREKYTLMTGVMRLNYDVTEALRASLASSVTRLKGKTYDKYPGEYADPRGFIQDDETTDDYIAARIRVDLSLILNHDPFKYRVGDLFVYFGGGRYNYDIRATDPSFENKRRLIEDLWWAVWAAGMRYDMGESLRFSLIAAQHYPQRFMNYDYIYWDERGELYATGLGSGASTEVFISIDGAF